MAALNKLWYVPLHFTVWTVIFTVLVTKITVYTMKCPGTHRNFSIATMKYPSAVFSVYEVHYSRWPIFDPHVSSNKKRYGNKVKIKGIIDISLAHTLTLHKLHRQVRLCELKQGPKFKLSSHCKFWICSLSTRVFSPFSSSSLSFWYSTCQLTRHFPRRPSSRLNRAWNFAWFAVRSTVRKIGFELEAHLSADPYERRTTVVARELALAIV